MSTQEGKVMTDLDELNKLECLSKKISDLINQNKFENILELDLQRKKLLNLLLPHRI